MNPHDGVQTCFVDCEAVHLATVVDVATATSNSRERTGKWLEVLHASCTCPQERVNGAVGKLGRADDFSTIIDA